MTEIDIDYKADDRDAVRRLCLDIETAKCPESDLEIERAIVKPTGNFKDTKTGTAEEKKAKQIAAKRDAVEDDDGLLDMNPVACIGIEADGQLWHFSWFPSEPLEPLKDVAKLVLAEDEREMLRRFARWCDTHCDDSTTILTWNGYNFDLSKIRHRCSMYKIKLPDILGPESTNRNVDLMHVYANKYTVNKTLRKFVGQPVACKLLKIDSRTKEMTDVAGANFPQAIAEGKYYRGALYNLFDVVDLSEIGARMGY